MSLTSTTERTIILGGGVLLVTEHHIEPDGKVNVWTYQTTNADLPAQLAAHAAYLLDVLAEREAEALLNE
jgi:hypothetical protein